MPSYACLKGSVFLWFIFVNLKYVYYTYLWLFCSGDEQLQILLDMEFYFKMCFKMPLWTSFRDKSSLPQGRVGSPVLVYASANTSCAIQVMLIESFRYMCVHTHARCVALPPEYSRRTSFWEEAAGEPAMGIAGVYWARTACRHRAGRSAPVFTWIICYSSKWGKCGYHLHFGWGNRLRNLLIATQLTVSNGAETGTNLVWFPGPFLAHYSSKHVVGIV